MQGHRLHRLGAVGGIDRCRAAPRPPPPPPTRAPAKATAQTQARSRRRRHRPLASSSPPIVEWCPAGAAASVDEEESDARLSSSASASASATAEPDSWRRPLGGWTRPAAAAAAAEASTSPANPHLPPVVALGKFDALHRGHQALARAAARECGGAPVLLSFSGMAAVLGWPPRRPLVARQDRARVLDLWARELAAEGAYGEEAALAARAETEAMEAAVLRRRTPATAAAAAAAGGGIAAAAGPPPPPPRPQLAARPFPPVRQRYVPFASVRSLPPEAFVDLLRGQMRAAGAVAGANFRFGFKAAGDSAALRRLCAERGMRCAIVGLLMRRRHPVERDGDGGGGGGGGEEDQQKGQGEEGAVSSSRVREQLAAGRVEAAARSLGRPHRAVFVVVVVGGGAASGGGQAAATADNSAEFLPLAGADALRNQPPAEGEYRARVSCYPLPAAAADSGGGTGQRRRDQNHHQDACLLELEARHRAWLFGSGGAEADLDHPPARAFFEEARVRVDAAGGVSAEAGLARQCLGGGGLGGNGGSGSEEPPQSFVLAVDFLGRSGGAWGRPEVRTEEEED